MPTSTLHPSIITISELLTQLHTHKQLGLTNAEVQKRQTEFGPNDLPIRAHLQIFKMYLRQFTSPFIYLLVGAAILTYVIGHHSDAVVVLLVLILNSVIGFVQEFRAEKKMQAIEQYLSPHAKVIREGKLHDIPARDVTIGDIVLIEAGDRVPADGRVIEAHQLKCDEKTFTGEALPTIKNANILTKLHTLSQQTNMVFMGATVSNGSAKVVVTTVGIKTELGRISQLLTTTTETQSPLEVAIRKLSSGVLLAVLGLIAFMIVIGLLKNYPLTMLVELAVSLAVSAIPEGLPVVVTITLSIGVWRMAKQHSVVRRLDALETLGSVDVICTDKTGTLTEGEMMVSAVTTSQHQVTVTGQGYHPTGEFWLDKKKIHPPQNEELTFIGTLAILSTDTRIEKNARGIYQPIGDPTEVALYVLGRRTGLRPEPLHEIYHVQYTQPFDQEKRYSVKVYQHENTYLTIVKGSPETLVHHAKAAKWALSSAQTIADQGYRVISLGYHHSKENPVAALKANRLPALTLLCNFSIEDPLRAESATAIAQCQKSGIRVFMVTGDHVMTAKHIAEQIGLKSPVVTGEELEKLSNTELTLALTKTSVIARSTPDLKMRLVECLQKQRQVVAMTGDGVNDAPALKQADVGIAMGQSGSDVARGAADIVLTDDNFANIVKAIQEGRVIWYNLRKVLFYLFSTSVGELLMILGAIMLGLPVPLLASQILWLNLVTDGFLDVALATEAPENEVMTQPPRGRHEQLLDRGLQARLLFTGLWMAAIGLTYFITQLHIDIQKARTLVMLNLAVIQWWNAWNARSEKRTVFSIPIFSNRALLSGLACCITLQVLAIYWPPLQQILHTVPLTATDWLISVSTASSILLIDVIWKKLLSPRFVAAK